MNLKTRRIPIGSATFAVALITAATSMTAAEERTTTRLSQTVDGVSVRFTDAKWCTLQDLGRKPGSGDDPRDKGLAIWYEVESDDPAIQAAVDGKLARHLMSVTTPSESGRPLRAEWQKDRQWVW